jgi:hypothetical protein
MAIRPSACFQSAVIEEVNVVSGYWFDKCARLRAVGTNLTDAIGSGRLPSRIRKDGGLRVTPPDNELCRLSSTGSSVRRGDGRNAIIGPK